MESRINICWKHSLQESEVQSGIDRVSASLCKEYGAKSERRANQLVFRCAGGVASGIYGSIESSPGIVRMIVELPFMHRPFASKIRVGIEAFLKKELGGKSC